MTGAALRVRYRPRVGILALVLPLAAACGSPRRLAIEPTPLRVGVSPDAPPLAYAHEGRLVGLEVDLAGRLADAVRRPLRVIEIRAGDHVAALLDGRVDVITWRSAGAPVLSDRVAITTPYLRSGVTGLVRNGDAARHRTTAAVLRAAESVGVTRGSAGEAYARETLGDCTIAVYPTTQAAISELREGAIDVFLAEAPLISWLASQQRGDLVGLDDVVAREDVAWAFRHADTALRSAAEAALARWQGDGTLAGALQRWLPAPRMR